eukprot:419323_1
MDQDDKIRQYVLKKQQQRERAQHLRNQRRTDRPPSGNQGNQGNQGNRPPVGNRPPAGNKSRAPQSFNSRPNGSFSAKNRIIGDPFAAPSNNENIDRNNGSAFNDAPPYDNHGHYDNNNNPPQNKYNRNAYHSTNNNDPNDYNPRSEDRYNNNTPFAKMSSSDVYNEPPRANNNNTNEDYNDYNTNFNRNASNNKWQTTPMTKGTRETRDNRGFTNQSNFTRETRDNRGFNRNNNDRNPGNASNHGGFARNRQTERNAMQYSPSMDAKETRNDLNEATHAHIQTKPNEMVKKNASYATAADVKKIVSMVEQLRGQMHALQFQIDNVKMENTKLKDKIVELENQQEKRPQSSNNNHQNQANYGRNNNPNQANNTRNDGFNSNNTHFNANNRNNEYSNARNTQQNTFGKSSKMDIDNDHMSMQQGTNNQNRNRNPPNNSNQFPANSGNFNSRNDPQIKFNFNNQNSNGFANTNGNSFNKTDDNFNTNGNRNNGFNSNGFNPNEGNNNSNFNASNRMNMNPHAQNGDDEEPIAAPPKSSAADLIAKLEQTQGAFVDEDAVERVQCRQCGRKFARAALERHIRICKKVFGQKRKAFNMKQQRADDDALKAQRNTNTAEIEAEIKRKKAAHKVKWKAQSSMLRQAIQQSKQIEQALKEGKSLADIPNIPSQIPDDRVPCPHCGRKFAEETAKRHIPKCQNIKSRPKALKRRR